MYNPYGAQGTQKPQATGYYPQMQQTQQPQQPSYNQAASQQAGFGNLQPNANSFPISQISAPQFPGYSNSNSQFNQASPNQTTGNYYGQQNTGMINMPGVDANGKQGSGQAPYGNSGTFQAPVQSVQTQGTGFYNVPFQQPQIQQPQSQQQPQQQSQQQPQQTDMQSQLLAQQRTGPQLLAQQPTGPQLLSQQRTGPQPQLLQQQQTGFGQPQQLLPQQTGFYVQSSQQQVPLEPLKPTATGFVNSFANNGINNDVKIPARRLSFITANDQAKFERLFRSRVPKGSNTISGNDCRAIFMKSGLQPSKLAKIWALCDTSKAGELLFPEFALAMHLVNDVLQGDSIPFELDTKTKNEVSSFIDAINLSIASDSYTDLSQSRTPFDQLINSGTPGGLQAQNTGFMPQTSFGAPLQAQITGVNVNNPSNNFGAPLQSQITGGAIPAQANFGAPLNPQITGSGAGALNNFGVPLQSQVTGGGIRPQITGHMPQTSFGVPAQVTGGQMSQQLTGGRLQPSNTGFMPQTSFIQAQATGNGMIQPQNTGGFSSVLSTQNTGNFGSFAPQLVGEGSAGLNSQVLPTAGPQQPQLTGSLIGGQSSGNLLQQQLTGGVPGAMSSSQRQTSVPDLTLMAQSTGSLIPQQATAPVTGAQQFGGLQKPPYGNFSAALPSMSTGNLPALQSQQTGYLPPSGFNPTMPLTAQKTGFGNNEIYSQSNFGSNFTAQNEDSITPEEKSLFYKIFETYDTQGKGLLDSASAVEIFRKSGLNRSDLEHIWTLCDVNNSGSLNKQEFALGMHLVYRKLNGFQLPNRLPISLIPSSTKIIDNVKNQLKNTRSDDSKQKSAKIDALSYKNNDDEAALPSFRNRRKVFSTTNDKPVVSSVTHSSSSNADKKREKLASLRKAIKEKRDRLNAERNREQSTSEQDELRRIETLKAEIKDLPQFSNVENDAVPAELRERFDGIISKLPHLFSQITEADNDITKARIQLFKLKTPSSIIGTGPNGEITEDDRKKAKSKALLKARMDALTGKQTEAVDSLDQEEIRYNSEISKIKEESCKNQHIIDDIRRSISEISASLKSNLNGGAISGSPSDFGKWEFGIGLEPDIRRFINTLSCAKPIKSGSTTSSSTTKFTGNPRGLSQPVSDLHNQNDSRYAANNSSTNYHSQAAPSQSQKKDSTEDEEDEEERKLREQLEKLKLKKKADKEKRLAELRRQIEEAENDSEEDQNDSTNSGLKNANSGAAEAVTGPSGLATQPFTQNSSTSTPAPTSVPALNSIPPISSTATGGRNPFFKQEASSATSFDAKAAETQRRLQRGLGDDGEDDGWSDDESETNHASQTGGGPGANIIENQPAPVEVAQPQKSPAGMSQNSAVPLAPPLPAIGGANESVSLPPTSTAASTVPVPVAPPLPQITGSNGSAPVPTAPPLPQVNASSSFIMPPPPSLPGATLPAMTPAQTPQLAETHEDSDDVLSIPESVASEEDEDQSRPPAGIPPPPPLP